MIQEGNVDESLNKKDINLLKRLKDPYSTRKRVQ